MFTRAISARPAMLTGSIAVIGIAVTIDPVASEVLKIIIIVSVIALAAGAVLADSAREKAARAREEEAKRQTDAQLGLHRVGIDATLVSAEETQRQVGELGDGVDAGLDEVNARISEIRSAIDRAASLKLRALLLAADMYKHLRMREHTRRTFSKLQADGSFFSYPDHFHDAVTAVQFVEKFDERLANILGELRSKGVVDDVLDDAAKGYKGNPGIMEALSWRLESLVVKNGDRL